MRECPLKGSEASFVLVSFRALVCGSDASGACCGEGSICMSAGPLLLGHHTPLSTASRRRHSQEVAFRGYTSSACRQQIEWRLAQQNHMIGKVHSLIWPIVVASCPDSSDLQLATIPATGMWLSGIRHAAPPQ